jgi:hypothetical protein
MSTPSPETTPPVDDEILLSKTENKGRETPKWQAVLGGIAIGSAVGAFIFVPDILAVVAYQEGREAPASQIALGVPGQVERHIGDGSNGHRRLVIEQCQVDVNAARLGQVPTESIDQAVGKVGAGCIVDTVAVGLSTWINPDGTIVTWGGDPYEYLPG